MKTGVGVAILVFYFACELVAQIEWENPTISEKGKPDGQKSEFSFTFSNVGANSVTINEIRSSCWCTVAELDKKTYLPGERGTISVTFDPKMKTGIERSTIKVTTDDPGKSDIELKLSVDIPKWARISPPFLLWKRGGGADAKEFSIITTDPGSEIVSVESANPAFQVEKADRQGKVRVKPVSVDSKARGEVHVKVKLPDETTRDYRAYVIVK